MKVVLTGSHFSPAYAVIKASKWDLAYIGRKFAFESTDKESLEYKLCKKEKINFYEISVPRFSRVASVQSFPIFRFTQSIQVARQLLSKIEPDVVLSFGGYVSLPVVFAARMKNIPIIIHEQTLDAGLANKIASRFANRICISFPNSRKYFPKKKIILSGNPVREEVLGSVGKKVVTTDRKIIYITGGSTGSAAINSIVGEIMPYLTTHYTVVHQTGASEVDVDKMGIIDKKHYVKREYFTPKEVSWLLQNAACVVTRSGINTVTEILCLGAPAIFIPLPYGQKNEQLKNAKYAERFGFTRYLIQESITAEALKNSIRDMIKKGRPKKIAESELLIHKKAVEKIIHETEKLYQKKEEQRVSQKALFFKFKEKN